MKTSVFENSVKIWLSADDTYNWAEKPGARWPCSELCGHRVFCEFDRGNLVDFTVDSKEKDVSCDELNALIEFYWGDVNPVPSNRRK